MERVIQTDNSRHLVSEVAQEAYSFDDEEEKDGSAATHIQKDQILLMEELCAALGELESGNALSDFVEGHGIQSLYFAFSWRSDWLSISYRLPYARVLSGEEAMSLDNARIGAAIRMAMLLLASTSADALLHDGEAALSVEAGEFGVRYAITGPDGDEIDSADDWQPLIARLENDISSAGESLHIIWP